MFLLNYFIDQIRKFAHYQYYYLLTMNESFDKIVNDFIVVCITFLNMFFRNHFVDEFENRCIVNINVFYSSTITFDAQSKTKTKLSREINFSLSEIDRIFYFFLKIIRTRNTFFNWKFFVKYNFFLLFWVASNMI